MTMATFVTTGRTENERKWAIKKDEKKEWRIRNKKNDEKKNGWVANI